VIYFCCDEQRRHVVQQQSFFNGIDFLEVVDNPADLFELRQRTLHVHFIHPLAPGALTLENVRIEGGTCIRRIEITSVEIGGMASPPGSPPQMLPADVLVVRVGPYQCHSDLRRAQYPFPNGAVPRYGMAIFDRFPPTARNPRTPGVGFLRQAPCRASSPRSALPLASL
jgi:hypothetical protein